jgi:hypothetical protein
MNKKKWGIGAASTLGLVIVFHFATLPPAPPEIPPVPSEIKIPEVPKLTAYDLPTGNIPVSTEPYRSTNRSVSIAHLVERNLGTGVYQGTPYWKKRAEWFDKNFLIVPYWNQTINYLLSSPNNIAFNLPDSTSYHGYVGSEHITKIQQAFLSLSSLAEEELQENELHLFKMMKKIILFSENGILKFIYWKKNK